VRYDDFIFELPLFAFICSTNFPEIDNKNITVVAFRDTKVDTVSNTMSMLHEGHVILCGHN
jgi:hypothetical protein